jgi:hypothetical protein
MTLAIVVSIPLQQCISNSNDSLHRLDKYYMLLRRVIFYTFKYISQHDWDLGIIDDYSELLKNGPLQYVEHGKFG